MKVKPKPLPQRKNCGRRLLKNLFQQTIEIKHRKPILAEHNLLDEELYGMFKSPKQLDTYKSP